MNRLTPFGVLVAVAMTLLMPAAPASAVARSLSQAPAQQAETPVTFGIRPSSATAPDDRNGFTFGATPGAAVQDHVAVNNVGAEPVTLRVYAGDAFNTPEGGFDILAADLPSKDAGSWITLERDSVTIPSGGTVIVPFGLTVPADATPGDHAAGIVASLLTDRVEADGSRIAVDNRVGTRVYLRVAGDLKPQLSVEDIAGSYHQNLNPVGAGSATVSYTVRNTGNLRLEGAQSVDVTLPWGTTVDAAELPRLPELLPGSAITVTADVPSLVPAVLATAVVRVDPVSLPGDVNPALAAAVVENVFPAVPYSLLGLLALLVLFLVFRRWRRRPITRRPDPVDTARVGV